MEAFSLGLGNAPGHAFLTNGGVSDNAISPQVLWPHFKLWFDQGDAPTGGGQPGLHSGPDMGQGDEGQVNDNGIGRGHQIAWGQVFEVGLLQVPNERVVSKRLNQLIGAHVDSVDHGCASVQADLSESARGGAQVQDVVAANSDLKMVESSHQFERSP